MQEALIDWLKGIFGENIVFGLIVIGLLIYLIYKISSWFALSKQKIDNVPCDKHDEMIKNLDSSTTDIKISLARIEERSKTMNKRFEGIEGRIDMMQSSVVKILEGRGRNNDFTKAHSPISLTPQGKEKADELGLDGIISKNWETISNIISEVKNPYDIQSAFIVSLISTPEKYIDKESLDSIKNDAYMNGIGLIDYMRMVAVMARDRYFAEHQIDVGEIDKHDPSTKG